MFHWNKIPRTWTCVTEGDRCPQTITEMFSLSHKFDTICLSAGQLICPVYKFHSPMVWHSHFLQNCRSALQHFGKLYFLRGIFSQKRTDELATQLKSDWSAEQTLERNFALLWGTFSPRQSSLISVLDWQVVCWWLYPEVNRRSWELHHKVTKSMFVLLITNYKFPHVLLDYEFCPLGQGHNFAITTWGQRVWTCMWSVWMLASFHCHILVCDIYNFGC